MKTVIGLSSIKKPDLTKYLLHLPAVVRKIIEDYNYDIEISLEEIDLNLHNSKNYIIRDNIDFITSFLCVLNRWDRRKFCIKYTSSRKGKLAIGENIIQLNNSRYSDIHIFQFGELCQHMSIKEGLYECLGFMFGLIVMNIPFICRSKNTVSSFESIANFENAIKRFNELRKKLIQ